MFEQEQSAEQNYEHSQLYNYLKLSFVAGLAVWVLTSLILYNIPENTDFKFKGNSKSIIVNSFAFGYLIAAFILLFLNRTTVIKNFPEWLSLSVLGSTVSTSMGAIAIKMLVITHPMITLFPGYSGKFFSIVLGTIILSLYTMPFTLLVYYLSKLKESKKYFSET